MTHQGNTTDASAPEYQLARLEPIPPLDILGLLQTIWNGKWIVAFTLICTVLVAGFYAFRIAQPRYQATSAISVEAIVNANTDEELSVSGRPIDDVQINTELGVILSDLVLEQVVVDLESLSDPEFNRHLNAVSPFSLAHLRRTLRHVLAGTTDRAPTDAEILRKTVENLRGAVTASRRADTYILQVTARSGSAEKAEILANSVIRQYAAFKAGQNAQAMQANLLWLEQRVESFRHQMATQEDEMSGLIAAAQLQDDAGLDALSSQVLAAEQALSTTQAEMSAISGNPQGSSQRIAAELTQKQAVHDRITAQLNQLRTQLAGQSRGLARLHELQREIGTTRELYSNYLAQYQQIQGRIGRVLPDKSAITSANNGHYIGPQKVLILGIATLLGLILGLLLIVIKESLRRGVVTPIQVRRMTGLPVFAQFYQSTKPTARHMKRLRKKGPTGPLRTSIKELQTSLRIASQGKAAQMILYTSSVSGEGKTIQALVLAQAFAKANQRVLMICADPNGHSLLSSVNAIHVPKAITPDAIDAADTITNDTAWGIDTLVIEDRKDGPDVVLSDGFTTLIEQLRNDYDHIIVDAAPVTTMPQTLLWAQQADCVLYTIRWAKTPIQTIMDGLQALKDAEAPATGLVLSKINARKMKHLRRAHSVNTATGFATV